MSPRVLVLTPWVPYPVTGACQQDRFTGYRHFQRLGYDIRVIAKIHAFQDKTESARAFAEAGIPLTLVEHPESLLPIFLKRLPRILRSPSLIDGAAMEYIDPVYERVVKDEVERSRPDVIWIEYTPLWPVIRLLKPYGIPIVMKSLNNEPYNCVDEHGGTLVSRLKSIPKYGGERAAARESDIMVAITPVEEAWYRSWGAQRIYTQPLRGLAASLRRRTHADKTPLNVVFLSSSYNMRHNRESMLFIVRYVVPRLRAAAPGAFKFFLTGKKFKDADRKYLGEDVETTGFVPDLRAFLDTMDIAVCPWFIGQGMQQKVFEPLCCSLPLVTNKTGGYPFEPGKEYLQAQTPQEYADALLSLRDAAKRQALADAAYAKSHALFNEDVLLENLRGILEAALARRTGV